MVPPRARWWQKHDRWVWAYVIGFGLAAHVTVRLIPSAYARTVAWHFCYSAFWLLLFSRWTSPRLAFLAAVGVQVLWNAGELFVGGLGGLWRAPAGGAVDPFTLLMSIVVGAALGYGVLMTDRRSFWYRQLGVRAQRDEAPMPVLPETVPQPLDPDDVPDEPQLHEEQ